MPTSKSHLYADDERIKIPFFTPSRGIPQVINQVFLSGWDTVPSEIRDVIVPSLRSQNPDWQYRFFDAAAATKFIEKFYGPEMLSIYESIDTAYYAARGDLLRYLILYAEGGVYIDMKSDITCPLDSILKPDDSFLLS